MESSVVFAHELVQLDILRILPPLLPVFVLSSQVVGGDRDVADRSVKPDIEHLVLVIRHLSAPLQIPGDTSTMETFIQQLSSELGGILRPVSFDTDLLDPLSEIGRDLGQVDEDVLGGLRLGLVVAKSASWVDQLNGIDQFAAAIALITTGVIVATVRASASYESIVKEAVAAEALELGYLLLVSVALLLEVDEDVLSDLGMLFGAGSAKQLGVALEPLVNLLVDLVVLVADLLWCHALLDGFDLSGCSVLVCAADEDGVVASLPTEPGIDVG